MSRPTHQLFLTAMALIAAVSCGANEKVDDTVPAHRQVSAVEDGAVRRPSARRFGNGIDISQVTIVFDNYPYDPRLTTEWGFAAVISHRGRTLLFDTGGSSIVVENLQRLGINPLSIETIVLSHEHGDHVNGLQALLATGMHPTVYLPASFSNSFKQQVRAVTELVEVDGSQQILPGVLTTGEMGSSIVEQALVLEVQGGIVVVTGCAHPGVVDMVARAGEILDEEVLLVVGGFHLGSFSNTQVRGVIAELQRLGVQSIAPTHCTGDAAIALIADAFGDGYHQAGAGRSFTFLGGQSPQLEALASPGVMLEQPQARDRR